MHTALETAQEEVQKDAASESWTAGQAAGVATHTITFDVGGGKKTDLHFYSRHDFEELSEDPEIKANAKKRQAMHDEARKSFKYTRTVDDALFSHTQINRYLTLGAGSHIPLVGCYRADKPDGRNLVSYTVFDNRTFKAVSSFSERAQSADRKLSRQELAEIDERYDLAGRLASGIPPVPVLTQNMQNFEHTLVIPTGVDTDIVLTFPAWQGYERVQQHPTIRAAMKDGQRGWSLATAYLSEGCEQMRTVEIRGNGENRDSANGLPGFIEFDYSGRIYSAKSYDGQSAPVPLSKKEIQQLENRLKIRVPYLYPTGSGYCARLFLASAPDGVYVREFDFHGEREYKEAMRLDGVRGKEGAELCKALLMHAAGKYFKEVCTNKPIYAPEGEAIRTFRDAPDNLPYYLVFDRDGKLSKATGSKHGHSIYKLDEKDRTALDACLKSGTPYKPETLMSNALLAASTTAAVLVKKMKGKPEDLLAASPGKNGRPGKLKPVKKKTRLKRAISELVKDPVTLGRMLLEDVSRPDGNEFALTELIQRGAELKGETLVHAAANGRVDALREMLSRVGDSALNDAWRKGVVYRAQKSGKHGLVHDIVNTFEAREMLNDTLAKPGKRGRPQRFYPGQQRRR